jgi:hypothetical protein
MRRGAANALSSARVGTRNARTLARDAIIRSEKERMRAQACRHRLLCGSLETLGTPAEIPIGGVTRLVEGREGKHGV